MFRKTFPFFAVTLAFLNVNEPRVYAETPNPAATIQNPGSQQNTKIPAVPAAPFKAFTGKITRNKVRMRLQPTLDAPILKELTKDDMLIVIGEVDEFYAVQPPSDVKAFIFRTFVLDNVVEGNRVNVRLEPELEAPVIAQLNSGDRVQGTISPLNSKWLEITPPSSARFYVCKEYVEKIGDSNLLSTIEKRKDEVNTLLNSTYQLSQSELQKPFSEINLEVVINNFNKVINNYSDFPDQVARAKELINTIQDTYLKKKIAYLEAKTQSSSDSWQNRPPQISQDLDTQQKRLNELQQQINVETTSSDSLPSENIQTHEWKPLIDPAEMSARMAAWFPSEKSYYEIWAKLNAQARMEDYYKEQMDEAVVLKGILEQYNRNVKNKPGDYLIINQATHLPTAYLYSTQVNLQDWVGHEIKVKASPRPNNNFAFPAYFVLSIE